MIDLILLFLIGVLQNAAFTWSGRSRASGDVAFHAIAAVFSNGTWIAMQFLIWRQLWAAVTSGESNLWLTAIVYVSATVIGSCSSMWFLLRVETGKRRVGAR